MSGFDEADRLRARQDSAARAKARRDRMDRQEAREASECEAKRAAQMRIVAEAKAAREQGLMEPAAAPARSGMAASTGRSRDVCAIASRLERKAERDEADASEAKDRRRDAARLKASGVGRKVEVGIKDVPDPYRPGERITVAVNLAEHPLEMMLSRGRLDQPLYEAGVRFRMIYEAAAIGPGRGIDPGKIRVDGGRGPGDPLTDSVVHAQFELARLARALGMVGESIVSQVAGQGVTVSDLAVRWPGPEAVRAKMDYLSLRLREALNLLATEIWGAKGPAHANIRSERGMGTGVIDDRAVDVANQSYLRKRGIDV